MRKPRTPVHFPRMNYRRGRRIGRRRGPLAYGMHRLTTAIERAGLTARQAAHQFLAFAATTALAAGANEETDQ